MSLRSLYTSCYIKTIKNPAFITILSNKTPSGEAKNIN